MDFIVGLPQTPKGMNSIWVIVDRLSKSAHFLHVKTLYDAYRLAIIYIDKIVCLHGVPVSIVTTGIPNLCLDSGRVFKEQWEWN